MPSSGDSSGHSPYCLDRVLALSFLIVLDIPLLQQNGMEAWGWHAASLVDRPLIRAAFVANLICSAMLFRPRPSADHWSSCDAPTAGEWQTCGRTGRAGQDTLPVPAFEIPGSSRAAAILVLLLVLIRNGLAWANTTTGHVAKTGNGARLRVAAPRSRPSLGLAVPGRPAKPRRHL
jgi:hypothetical protein